MRKESGDPSSSREMASSDAQNQRSDVHALLQSGELRSSRQLMQNMDGDEEEIVALNKGTSHESKRKQRTSRCPRKFERGLRVDYRPRAAPTVRSRAKILTLPKTTTVRHVHTEPRICLQSPQRGTPMPIDITLRESLDRENNWLNKQNTMSRTSKKISLLVANLSLGTSQRPASESLKEAKDRGQLGTQDDDESMNLSDAGEVSDNDETAVSGRRSRALLGIETPKSLRSTKFRVTLEPLVECDEVSAGPT